MRVALRMDIAHRTRDLALWDVEDACLSGGIEITAGTDLYLRIATLLDERRQPADLQFFSDRDEDIGLLQLQDEARLGLDEVRVLIAA